MNWVLLRISRQVGWRWRRPQDKFGLWLLVYFREEVVLSDPSVIFLCSSISAILCARGGGGVGGVGALKQTKEKLLKFKKPPWSHQIWVLLYIFNL